MDHSSDDVMMNDQSDNNKHDDSEPIAEDGEWRDNAEIPSVADAVDHNALADKIATRFEKLLIEAFGDQIPTQLQRAEFNALKDDLAELAGKSSGETNDLRAEIEKWKDAAHRIKADYLNYQDRMRRERDQLSEFALRSFVETLLPTLDNFDVSLMHSLDQAKNTDNPELNTLIDAVQLIHASLMNALKNKGLEVINEKGVKFNPEIHEAVARVPNTDVAHEHVVDITRTGYIWHGRVLRPAQVVVSDNPEKQNTKDAAGGE